MIEVRVPDLGLEEHEKAEVIAWRASTGEPVARETELVDLGVDKAVFTLTSPVEGRLKKVVVPEGSGAIQHAVLCVIEEGGKEVRK